MYYFKFGVGFVEECLKIGNNLDIYGIVGGRWSVEGGLCEYWKVKCGRNWGV